MLTLFSVACSQEEEDLVNAHRKQVEETMNIVREVCGLARAFLFHFLLVLVLKGKKKSKGLLCVNINVIFNLAGDEPVG